MELEIDTLTKANKLWRHREELIKGGEDKCRK